MCDVHDNCEYRSLESRWFARTEIIMNFVSTHSKTQLGKVHGVQIQALVSLETGSQNENYASVTGTFLARDGHSRTINC